jgi:hypothetical protein
MMTYYLIVTLDWEAKKTRRGLMSQKTAPTMNLHDIECCVQKLIQTIQPLCADICCYRPIHMGTFCRFKDS